MLAGLLASASDVALERITAPMPIAQLDALLDVPPLPQPQPSPADMVVRFEPRRRDLSPRQVVLFSVAVWLLLGLLVLLVA